MSRRSQVSRAQATDGEGAWPEAGPQRPGPGPRSGTSFGAAPREPLARWLEALADRHLSELRFPEVRRALQALSSLYVERRQRLASGSALDGAGKRAAFAVYYGPLHFLLVRSIVRSLDFARRELRQVQDLGCGTAAAGAAWALEAGGCRVSGVEKRGWAVEEARWTLHVLGLPGAVREADVVQAQVAGAGAGVLAAFVVNELEASARSRLLFRLLDAHARGAQILIVEPLARKALPWWEEWASAFAARSGRQDLWRFPVELPEWLQTLDQAAGLRHRELTGRSLALFPSP
jgi:hypothetical protein